MNRAWWCTIVKRSLFMAFVALQAAQAQPTVSVSPAAKNAIPGSVFTLNIAVDGVANLHLYHVILHFDNTMLRCESVSSGGFFPGTFFMYSPSVLPSDTARYLTVDDALMGTQTLSGSGTFFSVQFRALQEGVSTVLLMEVVLRDGNNQNITHSTVNGTVTGTYPSVVWVSPLYSPGSAGAHDFGFDAFSNVTAGITVVTNNGTVNVLSGTYREQLYINKNIALLGAGAANTKLVPPVAVMSQPFLPARQERPIIGVDSLGTNVVIDGFTVDGEGVGDTQAYLTGIQYFKSSGVIRNSTIKRIRSTPFNGAQMYVPILVNHDYPRLYAHSVEVHNDSVYDFGKTGIVVNHPGSAGNVHHNVVTGQGPTALNAQNGIQFGFGATGTMAFNAVSGLSYTGTGASASSLLLAGSTGTSLIHNNTVTQGQVGLYLSQDGSPDGTCDATIYANTFTASTAGAGTADYFGMITSSQGALLNAGSVQGRKPRPPSPFETGEAVTGRTAHPALTAMSVTLAGNTFASLTPASGVAAYLLAMGTSPQTLVGDSNSFSGYAVGVVTDKDPGASLQTTWRRNRFTGNSYGMYDLTGTLQDARQNWWGHATGPRDVKLLPNSPNYNNPNGSGDSVWTAVEYNPWYVDSPRTLLSYYPLTVNVTGGGSVVRSPDTSAYLYFTDVVLTANPAPACHFVGWSGDTVSASNPITVRMTGARNITAMFAFDQYPLAVTIVGGGSVDRAPDQPLYDAGTLVTLTANPAIGYTFVGWSGDTTTGGNPLTLRMTSARAVTATFATNVYPLSITLDGSGTVSRNPDQASYLHGTQVGLKAVPSIGWHFVGWTGDTTAAADTLLIVMTGARTLTARFEINTYSLNVSTVGIGTVTRNPDQGTYTHGTPVGLKATPSGGYHFVGWSGDSTGTADTLFIVMTRDRTLIATFSTDVYPVNVVISGHGTVTRAPNQPGYAPGTNVTLTGLPGGSYSFVGWTGDTITTANPISFTVWGPVNVTAIFTGDKFVSIPPESLLLKNFSNVRLLKPARPGHDLYPNWINLLAEVVIQGGFQDLSSESDQAGGMLVGLSYLQGGGGRWRPVRDSARIHGWLRLTKWSLTRRKGSAYTGLQRSLEDKSGMHVGRPRGLDILTTAAVPPWRLVTGEKRSLPPKRHNNKLLAEMVALKLNIAASQLAKCPIGFGELTFQQPGHDFHGRTILEIAERTDSLMTFWQGRPFAEYDSMYSAIARINRAFVAPLDTASWAGPGQLVVNGMVSLSAVPFLNASDFPPVILSRTTDERESEDEFEETDFDDVTGRPVAAVLLQNYPNPFNPSTTLEFRLHGPSLVSVTVFDILGREVARLMEEEDLDEGEQTLEFYADGLASGTYMYRIEVRDPADGVLSAVQTRKMLLVK
jgi:uncharacterized repeat protein (TIGR02543 family)